MSPLESRIVAAALRTIVPASAEWRARARARISTLAMPPWALGRLLDLATDLSAITRSLAPPTDRRTVVVMAGDHGVVREGVSAFPPSVTQEMVRTFARGNAGINVLAEQSKARVIVVDVGTAGDLDDLADLESFRPRKLGYGTANIAEGPAMSRAQALSSLEIGLRLADELGDRVDLLATGDMGIGNTTPSAALCAVLCEADPLRVTGHGTGIDEPTRRRKADIVARSIAVNRPDPDDPVDVLAKIGGYEIGALAGLLLGAAMARKPVLVDGFISTAAALVAQRLCPASTDYMIAAHRSAEPGHDVALRQLGKQPLLDLGLRLGEGTGAVLAMPLVEAASRILHRMATFADAGITRGTT